MDALFAAINIRSAMASWGPTLLVVILILSILFALLDHGELKKRLVDASGKERTQIKWRLVLVWAIPLITAVAGLCAYFESEITTTSLDLRNQPVRNVAAHVSFTFDTDGILTNRNIAGPICATLSFSRAGKGEDPWALHLCTDKFETWGGNTNGNCFLDLQWMPFFRYVIGTNHNESVRQLSEELDKVLVCPLLLPENTQIRTGLVTLTLNSTIEQKFVIPAQKFSEFRPLIAMKSH
jgi:hypothetical protein